MQVSVEQCVTAVQDAMVACGMQANLAALETATYNPNPGNFDPGAAGLVETDAIPTAAALTQELGL